jgi:uncharacterized protein YecT (DUF1311 family)
VNRVAAAVIVCAVFAGSFVVSARADDCGDKQTQTDMNICAGDEFSRADDALNKAYKQILACLKADSIQGKLLISAQRAWISFRDAECRFQVGERSDGGSIWPMLNAGCLRDVTNARNSQLTYYLTCKEGDLSCPTFSCKFK